jgi:hypothetical protein
MKSVKALTAPVTRIFLHRFASRSKLSFSYFILSLRDRMPLPWPCSKTTGNHQVELLGMVLAELADQSEIARRLSIIGGFGEICIAELAGEIGTVERFDAEASLALYLGMSPLNDDSVKHHSSKSPRRVNRRAKAAMMTAVVRHIDCVPESRAYYDKKRDEGKKHNQAVRALGRHLVRVIWSMLKNGRDYELREVTPMR